MPEATSRASGAPSAKARLMPESASARSRVVASDDRDESAAVLVNGDGDDSALPLDSVDCQPVEPQRSVARLPDLLSADDRPLVAKRRLQSNAVRSDDLRERRLSLPGPDPAEIDLARVAGPDDRRHVVGACREAAVQRVAEVVADLDVDEGSSEGEDHEQAGRERGRKPDADRQPAQAHSVSLSR